MVPQSLRTYTPCCHDHSRTPDKINILIINWKRGLYEHVLKIGCMRMKFCRHTTEDTLKCDIIINIIIFITLTINLQTSTSTCRLQYNEKRDWAPTLVIVVMGSIGSDLAYFFLDSVCMSEKCGYSGKKKKECYKSTHKRRVYREGQVIVRSAKKNCLPPPSALRMLTCVLYSPL